MQVRVALPCDGTFARLLWRVPVSEVRVTSTERSDKVIKATLFSGLERVLEWVIRFTASWIGERF